MKNRIRRRCAVLLTLLLLTGPVIAAGLWLRAQQRQYALNRRLIAALVQEDALVSPPNKLALDLVNEGADPNTRAEPTPVPSLSQLLKQMLHRSPPLANHSPTALLIVCGAYWTREQLASDNRSSSPSDVDDVHRLDDAMTPLVTAMLMHGAKVNALGSMEYGQWSALQIAVSKDRPRAVELLLQHGANVNPPSAYVPILTLAIQNWNDPQTLGVLIEHGADVNARDAGGQTPLMAAADIALGHIPQMAADPAAVEIVRLLLEHGANVNVQDHWGKTALHNALVKHLSNEDPDKDVIRLMLAHGADPNLADISGVTPLMLAQSDKQLDIVALLKHAGARK